MIFISKIFTWIVFKTACPSCIISYFWVMISTLLFIPLKNLFMFIFSLFARILICDVPRGLSCSLFFLSFIIHMFQNFRSGSCAALDSTICFFICFSGILLYLLATYCNFAALCFLDWIESMNLNLKFITAELWSWIPGIDKALFHPVGWIFLSYYLLMKPLALWGSQKHVGISVLNLLLFWAQTLVFYPSREW